MQTSLPNAEFVELPKNRTFFEDWWDLDALLISVENGSAFTHFYPEFDVVVPDGPRTSLPLFYAIGAHDAELRDFLEYWITLRRKDGTMQENYDHWILGKLPASTKPRWSVLRDVLGWVR